MDPQMDLNAVTKRTMLKLKLHKIGGVLAPIILNDIFLKKKLETKLVQGYCMVPHLHTAFWHLWVTCEGVDYDIGYLLNSADIQFQEHQYCLLTDRALCESCVIEDAPEDVIAQLAAYFEDPKKFWYSFSKEIRDGRAKIIANS